MLHTAASFPHFGEAYLGPDQDAIFSKKTESAVGKPARRSMRRRMAPVAKRFNFGGSDIIGDTRPLPEELQDSKADEALFGETDPYVDGPISIDHALNFKVGKQSFLNFNPLGPRHMPHHCQLGKNVLFGPNVGLYGALHPMDPAKRRGLKDPEAEKEIHIEDDVWIGAGATILGGVRIGRGSTVGASSVVTKDVPPFHFVAGNPARIIRKIESEINPGFKGNAGVDEGQ